jgi:hypothetical protein
MANLSDDRRALLGVGDDESIRVLDQRRRTIVLERIRGEDSIAFPWDRELVLNADVGAFPLADVLQLLHASSKSGFLYFEGGDHEKSVYLHRGEVIFATSNQVFDRLGNCLLRAGLITPEQFEVAAIAYHAPEHYGKILVERGFLAPGELWNGVKLQIEEIVRSLFSYNAGCVLFWEGEVQPDNAVRLSLPTRRLVEEGLQRRDELIRFLAMLEGPNLRIEPQDANRTNLSGTERALFDLLGDGCSFTDACRGAGVEPLAGARTLRHLSLIGAVRISRGPMPSDHAAPTEAQGEDDALRSCVLDHLKLIAELVTPIIAVEGAKGIRERLARVVEEASHRYPELLSGLHVGAGGAIDPEELSARALRFPGEREREVRLALDELISYVEFELLNHPKISDPEDLLESTAALRANL